MSLQDFLRLDSGHADLAEGAIHAVAPMMADPDPGPTRRLLDAWAWVLAGRMPLPWNLHEALDAMNAFLFQEIGLHGDRDTYDDPVNAVLPSVIVRKKGLPVTLSILWIALARRLGFDAVGVALPGHFVVGLRTRVGLLHFDPFTEGRPLGVERAARMVHAFTGGRLNFEATMLDPVSDTVVLSRLVRVLHARFVAGERWDDSLWTAGHLVLLNPEDPRAYQERALVHLKRLAVPQALADLRLALELLREHSPELATQIALLEAGAPPTGDPPPPASG